MARKVSKSTESTAVVLLCIDESTDLTPIVRRARHRSEELGVLLYAVNVLSVHAHLNSQARERLNKNLELVRSLGIPVYDVGHGGIPTRQFFRRYEIKAAFQGKLYTDSSHRKRLLFYKLIEQNHDIRLETVDTTVLPERKVSAAPHADLPAWRGYAVGLGLISVITFVAESLKYLIDLNTFSSIAYNFSIIYLLAVIFLAIRYGFGAALANALLSFFLYNYLFIYPAYAFNVTKFEDYVNLVLFITATLGSAAVGYIMRESHRRLRHRERRTELLYYFNRNLANVRDRKMLIDAIGSNLEEMTEMEVVVFSAEDNRAGRKNQLFPEEPRHLSDIDKTAKRYALDNDSPAGHGTRRFPRAEYFWVPLTTVHNKLGIIGFKPGQGQSLPEIHSFIRALCNQAASAIERMNMTEVASGAVINEEREKLRSALLSSVSHDLKTPLASIIGSLSAIHHMRGQLNRRDEQELNLNALEEAQRLHNFINNILSMSKFESGRIELNKRWVNVMNLAKTALEPLHDLAGTRKVVLEEVLEDYRIYVDDRLFRQIFQNLLDNALKYSPAKTTITMSAYERREKNQHQLVVFVADEGRGIPPAMREKIFDKFTRLEHQDTRVAGTGLGLSIVRILGAAHGVRIEAVNNNEIISGTRGARFMLIFKKSLFRSGNKQSETDVGAKVYTHPDH